MLLPSALPCDLRRSSTRSRFTPSRLFSTPPSDDDFPSGNGLLGTCRALQALLNGSPAPTPRRAKPERLQSPLHITSTSSAGSRKRKKNNNNNNINNQTIKPSSPKPSPQPPRGASKRKRDSHEADDDSDVDMSVSRPRFSTPKRPRYVPYDLPLGLSQSDFYSLHSPPITQSPPSPAHRRQQEFNDENPSFNPDAVLPSIEETDETDAQPDNNSWTSEDDQRLVNLVLEKFQLSGRDWDECARQLGKDNASVGRRWQALVGEGNVGLRRGQRRVRGRIDESWL